MERKAAAGCSGLTTVFRKKLETPGISYRFEIFDFRQRWMIQVFRETL